MLYRLFTMRNSNRDNYFQMSSNRLAKSQLLRKLSELKKSSHYPVKPTTNPAILYVQNVLNPDNLSWDKPHKRPTNLNTTIKYAVRAWPAMDPKIKGFNTISISVD